MRTLRLWLRWSWRDLRGRWVQVAAIALIIALGTGTYAGMSSSAIWRMRSNDASYAVTNMYDLRVKLGAGSFAQTGSLEARLPRIDHASWIDEAEERLQLATQIEVPGDDGMVFVPGRIVGAGSAGQAPAVNRVHVEPGRELDDGDAGQNVVLLERNFADYYELPPEGEVRVAGGTPARYVGHGLAPEYFMVVTDEGDFLAQANFGVIFTTIDTAQRLAGRDDVVNDLVLTLVDSADTDVVVDELKAAFDDLGVTVMVPEDDLSYLAMTKDPEGDRQFWNIFGNALFLGAAFAAFNLTSRMVESQRREIGVAMALGAPAHRVALRPLLVGAQIALLGVVFGIGVGLLIGELMRGVLSSFLPLPVWTTPFQLGLFAGVAAAGFLLPFAAVSYPVWRAVRVAPVDAIRTGHLAARGGGLAPLLKRLPMPGDSIMRMPFRNLLRAPRRVLLTLLGVGSIITVLVGVVGMVDSFIATMDRGEREVLGDTPDRLEIALDDIYPVDSEQVASVLGASTLTGQEPGLRLVGTLSNRAEEIDAFIRLVDFDSALWRPTAVRGSLGSDAPGVVIAEKAAKDLGVDAGDTVTLRHPSREGPVGFAFESTDLPVLAVHPDPARANVYMDVKHAGLMGLEGKTNVIHARPAPGQSVDAVKRETFELPGVASAQGVAASAAIFRELMEQWVGILRVAEVAVLGLALLIAFNTASISADERAREYATMFAYGLPVRTVLRVAVIESALVGALATIVGLGGGYLFLRWIVDVVWPRVQPDLGVLLVFEPANLALVLGLGVLAVAAAPLLTVRRLRRMDVPSTLRVME